MTTLELHVVPTLGKMRLRDPRNMCSGAEASARVTPY